MSTGPSLLSRCCSRRRETSETRETGWRATEVSLRTLFGRWKRVVEGLVEDTAEQAGLVSGLVSLFDLAGDLGLADHHRVQSRRDAKKMASRRSTEMDVELVVLGQSRRALREIGKAAPQMKEQRVGMESGQAAEVDLHPVAGRKVDHLREAGEPGELDELLLREILRQACLGKLLDGGCAVAGADDADAVHVALRQGMIA